MAVFTNQLQRGKHESQRFPVTPLLLSEFVDRNITTGISNEMKAADTLYRHLLSVQIDDAGGVLVESQDSGLRGQQLFQGAETGLTHEAAPRIVGAALGVVPVWTDNQGETELP